MKLILNPQESRAGFTLIEVLIAILVLAIGMLGLGAIFPAVIAEQRDAFGSIEGEMVASSAQGMLSNPEFVDFSLISSDFNRPLMSGFGSPSSSDAVPRYAYEWVVPQDGVSYYGWDSPIPSVYNFFTGLWSFYSNDGGNAVNDDLNIVKSNPEVAQIPVSARLFPQPYSGKEPKYVWDLALRRSPGGDQLQAAVFVRRIDSRLRVPKGASLSDVLTDGNFRNPMPNGALLPVAINMFTGQPAVDDGQSNMVYAAIQMLEVEVHEEHLDWLIIKNGRTPGIDTSAGFAAKVGQKLLDNTGVVRTVVGLPVVDVDDPLIDLVSDTHRVVQVDPPFELRNAGGDDTDLVRSGARNPRATDPQWDNERASWVRQIIFTPRIPVTIRVLNLEESR